MFSVLCITIHKHIIIKITTLNVTKKIVYVGTAHYDQEAVSEAVKESRKRKSELGKKSGRERERERVGQETRRASNDSQKARALVPRALFCNERERERAQRGFGRVGANNLNN